MKYFKNRIRLKNNFADVFNEVNDKCYNIAEIGINHNGDIELAKELIKISKSLTLGTEV